MLLVKWALKKMSRKWSDLSAISVLARLLSFVKRPQERSFSMVYPKGGRCPSSPLQAAVESLRRPERLALMGKEDDVYLSRNNEENVMDLAD